MSGHRNFAELRVRMSSESNARIEERKIVLREEMALDEAVETHRAAENAPPHGGR
jgi:hypothetical protein